MSRLTGKRLASEHRVSVVHALYRESGDWFHILKRFPGALFDKGGYLRFASSGDYAEFVKDTPQIGVYEKSETNTLTVRDGISKHPDYVSYTQSNSA